MTLVIQSNLKRDLFHTQKTRLQQILGSLHAQQAQITNRRHADIRFENVTQSPNRKVYGLCELRERQFTTNVFTHHLDDFFYSFIHETPEGDVVEIQTSFLNKPVRVYRVLGGSYQRGKTESGKE